MSPRRPLPAHVAGILQPRRRKYGGKLCTDNQGVLYESQAERERAFVLQHLLAEGSIDWWSYGPRYVLVDATVDERTGKRTAAVTYRPDFIVRLNGVTWVEDVKGFAPATFALKQKLWATRYPNVELRVIREGTARAR
jgi:hypothetical protein